MQIENKFKGLVRNVRGIRSLKYTLAIILIESRSTHINYTFHEVLNVATDGS